jgi:cell wall-associated NlpC family hydrolase
LAVVVLLALLGGSASADRLADKRAEATRVQSELDQMDVALSKAIEAYDAAQTRLDATEAAIRENELELAITRKNLAVAQSDLTSQLVADYRSGAPDTIAVVLGAASISDMLARVDIIKRSSGHTAELVGKVLTLKQQMETASKRLAKQQKARQQALADRAARKAEIRAGIAARQQRLSSIGAEIRQIIAERAAAERRAEAARAAAARAAAAAAAAQPAQNDPGIGGSTGGDNGGGGSTGGGGGSTGGGGSSGGGGGGGGGGSTGDGGGASIPPPPSAGGSSVVSAALSQLGVPYQWGGSSPGQGFDCSGLVMWAYAQVGVSLPHNAAAQHAMGTPVSRADLQPGDIVFFFGDGHDGIYIGGGQFVHAPHTGDVVKISNLDGYPGYNGAVRI